MAFLNVRPRGPVGNRIDQNSTKRRPQVGMGQICAEGLARETSGEQQPLYRDQRELQQAAGDSQRWQDEADDPAYTVVQPWNRAPQDGPPLAM